MMLTPTAWIVQEPRFVIGILLAAGKGYSMTSTDMRVSVMLSVQRALLGHIGTTVRLIACRWTADEIYVRVVFDGEISDDDAEAISEAETEVIADFPSQIAVHFKLERRDHPASIKHENGEQAVFQRLEN